MPSERQSIVPFDQLFVFSTNLRRSELCDEAFLRRIPYKVHIPDPTARQIRELWQRQTQTHHVTCDAQWLDYLFNIIIWHKTDLCDFVMSMICYLKSKNTWSSTSRTRWSGKHRLTLP